MATTNTQENKIIRKARRDITRVLERYKVTLPEVMGITKKKDVDEEIWKSVTGDYEKIQEQFFTENYPALWKKTRKRR